MITTENNEFKLKKMKWKVYIKIEYGKYYWTTENEDKSLTFKSNIVYTKNSLCKINWESFAKENHMKTWIYI